MAEFAWDTCIHRIQRTRDFENSRSRRGFLIPVCSRSTDSWCEKGLALINSSLFGKSRAFFPKELYAALVVVLA